MSRIDKLDEILEGYKGRKYKSNYLPSEKDLKDMHLSLKDHTRFNLLYIGCKQDNYDGLFVMQEEPPKPISDESMQASLDTIKNNDLDFTGILHYTNDLHPVEFMQNGELKSERASKEVIVCSGALESPHLLLNSGIGDPEHLAQYDIPVLVDLPGVGENFHNHVLTGLIMETKEPVAQGNLNTSEAALFCKSEPGLTVPDLQFNFVHLPFDIIVGQDHPNSVSLIPGLQRPVSREGR